MDYSAILQFYPLLQQQQQLLQANAQHAAMLAAMQQAAQAQQQTAARAAAQPPAAAYYGASASNEPIPHINTALSSNVSLLSEIESEWRWGSVCLFFEHFLPLYPNRKLQFKPELLMQSFLCTHHSCFDHKWDACSCPHPACQQLAALFLQLLLMLHPIPEASKKLPKNQMNMTNYLPVLQNLIEKAYFAPNQTNGAREQIQEIMQLYLDDIAAKKEAEREEKMAEAEAQAEGNKTKMDDNDNNDDDAKDGAAAKGGLKFSLPITPPGSALLASHLHQLPALCKLYLLHFVCDYVLSEVDTLKEACTQSNMLAHGGGAAASTAGTAAAGAAAAAAATILPANPFHSRGLSEPHGRDDDGAAYWCFVHEEMGRVHLWRDVHTGAKDEFHVRMRRKGSDKLTQTKVHGDEPDDPDADDAEAIDMLDADQVEPVDADHAPPSFSFSLLASDLDAVQALVSVWAVTWKEVDGLVFLHKLKSDVLPNALLMQKKAERISRRDKSSRGSAAWTPPEFVGAQRWSSRTRKPVNYAELAEGDTSTAGAAAAAAEADEEYDAEASVGSKRPRRSTAGVSPAPYGSAAAATTQPAAAYTAEQTANMQQQQQNMQMMSMWAQIAMNQQAQQQAAAAAARQATPTLAPVATATNAQIPSLGAPVPTPSPVASVASTGSMAAVHTPASAASPSPVSIAAVQQQPAAETLQSATPATSPMPDAEAVMRAAAAASSAAQPTATPAASPVAAAMPAEAASSPAAPPAAEQPAAAATVAAQ